MRNKNRNHPDKKKPDRQMHRSSESWNCRVYAIELDASVMEDPAYRARNPNHIPGMPHLYIGATSLEIGERFRQHKTGHKNASVIARRYGLDLRLDLLPVRRPKRRTLAFRDERNDAWRLRKLGYGVWQA